MMLRLFWSVVLSAVIVIGFLFAGLMLFAYFAHGDDDPLIQTHRNLDERIRAVDIKLNALKQKERVNVAE